MPKVAIKAQKSVSRPGVSHHSSNENKSHGPGPGVSDPVNMLIVCLYVICVSCCWRSVLISTGEFKQQGGQVSKQAIRHYQLGQVLQTAVSSRLWALLLASQIKSQEEFSPSLQPPDGWAVSVCTLSAQMTTQAIHHPPPPDRTHGNTLRRC